MNYVFYDFETSGSSPIFDQILQAGAIVSKDFKTVSDKIELNCRLKKTIIPAPKALLINRISIDQLKSNEISHYSLVDQLKKKFEEWTPACFIGFNSISFVAISPAVLECSFSGKIIFPTTNAAGADITLAATK